MKSHAQKQREMYEEQLLLEQLKNKIPRCDKTNTWIFCCDIQKVFVPLVYNVESVIYAAKVMNQVSRIFDVPMIVTEQFPEKLGQTIPEVRDNLPKGQNIYSKSLFSMLTEEVKKELCLQPERNQIILFGIETHVAIQQTALDAMDMGYTVHLLVDGTSSQRELDRSISLKKLSSMGVLVTTTEAAIFEFMRDQQHVNFHAMLPTLKIPRPPQFPS